MTAPSCGRARSGRRGLRIGCAVVAAVVLGPILLLSGCIGVELAANAFCGPADPVLVRLRSTNYAVPARLQPKFSQTFPGKKLRTPYVDGRQRYCTGSKKPVVQRAVHFSQLSYLNSSAAAGRSREGLSKVKVFSIDGEAPRLKMTLSHDEHLGEPLFGRQTIERCWDGYYGPGQTCRITGWTRDGAGVTLQLHPDPSDAERAAAVQAAEALIIGIEAP
jgi:hypothetical protein